MLSPLLFPLHLRLHTCTWFKHHCQVCRRHNGDWSHQQQRWVGLQGVGPTVWCANNNLALNTKKTKELIVDYRKSNDGKHTTIRNNGTAVGYVASFKFLGVHISEDLSWTLSTSTLIKKAHQRLFFLRRLKKVHLSPQILVNFYRCTIESILTNWVTVWYGNCSVSDWKALQSVVKTAQWIIGTTLPSIEALHRNWCPQKMRSIVKDCSYPNHRLFSWSNLI